MEMHLRVNSCKQLIKTPQHIKKKCNQHIKMRNTDVFLALKQIIAIEQCLRGLKSVSRRN